jgi:dipeptidyl aminopeptidase/acylaminoacyl peptidase
MAISRADLGAAACKSFATRHSALAGSSGWGIQVYCYRLRSGAAVALALASAPVSAQSSSLSADATAFGARQAATNMDLSPDGTRLVYIGPGSGKTSIVYIGDLTTGSATPIIKSTGDPESLSWCDFVSNERLACRYVATLNDTGVLVGYSRMISMNIDGSDVKELGQRSSDYDARIRQFDGSIIDWLPGQDGSVLMTRDFIPEQGKLDTNVVRTKEGLGVVKLNARTLKVDVIERPSLAASGFMSDGIGHVRLMSIPETDRNGQLSGRMRYQYRTAGSRDWQMLVDYQDDDLVPLAIDATSNSLYALKRLDGRYALYRVKLDGSRAAELVASNPKVDIDDVVRAGDGQKVIGYTYSEERRRIVYFDPEYTQLEAALSRALKLPLVQFVNASADGRKVLLFAESDIDPGHYYLFDKTTKSLGEVAAARPELAKRALAPVKPVTYSAADGTKIPAYLTLPAGSSGKGMPAVVLPHGGPSARDEWGFDWLAQFLAGRGYAVIQPNYRGSAGFGDAWLGENGFKAWRTSIGDVTSAARWLASEGIADPNRIAIVGWSYGGYAALQSAATEPSLFKAVVAVAPISDLGQFKADASHYTSDRMVSAFVGSGPHVAEGSPARHASAISAPVLLFHGTMDENVTVGQSREMADALRDAGKPVEFVEFDGLDHQLEDSGARSQMLAKIGALLDRTIGH